jgi:Flp pilus assembly protein TadD
MALRKGGDCADWFLLAMTHWQLGHKVEARQSYNKAKEWMENHGDAMRNGMHEDWVHLRAEAAALLGVQNQPPKEKEKTDAKVPVP